MTTMATHQQHGHDWGRAKGSSGAHNPETVVTVVRSRCHTWLGPLAVTTRPVETSACFATGPGGSPNILAQQSAGAAGIIGQIRSNPETVTATSAPAPEGTESPQSCCVPFQGMTITDVIVSRTPPAGDPVPCIEPRKRRPRGSPCRPLPYSGSISRGDSLRRWPLVNRRHGSFPNPRPLYVRLRVVQCALQWDCSGKFPRYSGL